MGCKAWDEEECDCNRCAARQLLGTWRPTRAVRVQPRLQILAGRAVVTAVHYIIKHSPYLHTFLAFLSSLPYVGITDLEATAQDIKKAYRKKAMRTHPDKHPVR